MKVRLADLGDRVCCLALATAAIAGVAVLAWYVWRMPSLGWPPACTPGFPPTPSR